MTAKRHTRSYLVYLFLFDLSRGPFHKRVWRVIWKKLFCFRALLGVGVGPLLLFVCWHHSFPIAPLILVQKSQVNTLRVTLSKVDRGPKKLFHFSLQPSAEGRPNLTIGWKPPQGNGLSKKWKWSYCVGSSTVGLLSNCLLTLELSPAFKPNLGANGNLKTRSLAWN